MAGNLEFDGVVLDIEGTVCPISFVKEVLFPYFLRTLTSSLPTLWTLPQFSPYLSAFPPEHTASQSIFLAHIQSLVASDTKTAPLKNLQGYIWLSGYESGELKCPLFADVLPAFRRWREQGKSIVIYSSGSVGAQKLLFRYTDCKTDGGEDGEGDLTGFIDGYFDTVNAGMKGEKGSYVKIFVAMKAGTGEGKVGKKVEDISKWLFCSDRVEEVDAAREAGMQAVVVVREGNAALSEGDKERHVLIESFDEIGAGSGKSR
ncbi:HAD-like domain-containing protein [Cadophora sp. MPI-SDFR-AT-0126]|nr:HAD-like domain-containing protein [Leotiomycetes sp. MPI-SDFR-AT-0126]